MEEKPRPWFRFSLRTLFVLVTVVAVYLGWAMNWIHQRREFLATCLDNDSTSTENGELINKAPWPLRIVGEVGCGHIVISDYREGTLKQARALFPETDSIVYPNRNPAYPPAPSP